MQRNARGRQDIVIQEIKKYQPQLEFARGEMIGVKTVSCAKDPLHWNIEPPDSNKEDNADGNSSEEDLFGTDDDAGSNEDEHQPLSNAQEAINQSNANNNTTNKAMTKNNTNNTTSPQNPCNTCGSPLGEEDPNNPGDYYCIPCWEEYSRNMEVQRLFKAGIMDQTEVLKIRHQVDEEKRLSQSQSQSQEMMGNGEPRAAGDVLPADGATVGAGQSVVVNEASAPADGAINESEQKDKSSNNGHGAVPTLDDIANLKRLQQQFWNLHTEKSRLQGIQDHCDCRIRRMKLTEDQVAKEKERCKGMLGADKIL